MKQSPSQTLRIALLAAGCVVAGGAIAASDAAPSREAVQQAGQQPDVRTLDDNAQRQHDRHRAGQTTHDGKPSDRRGVDPARQPIDQQAGQTDVRSLDDNAQRQHDRRHGVESRNGPTAASRSAVSQPGQTGYAPDDFIESEMNSQAQGTRDWNRIDSNNDTLVSPTEMNNALQKQGK